MDVLEAGIRRLEAAHGWFGVSLHLSSLAVRAGAHEVSDIGADFGPDESCCEEMASGGDTRVREIVEALHDGRT